jgi:ankyrin repeat protein
LNIACARGRPVLIEAILSLERLNEQVLKQANSQGETPFYLVCYSGNLDAARKLFSLAPTTLTTQNNEGRTSLMEAAYFGYTEIIEWLLD